VASQLVAFFKCPLFGPWQTFDFASRMSAFEGKADITFRGANVGF
jgi:hypothetical protein